MKLLNIQHRIRELMSIFVTQVKGATTVHMTDINHVSETVLIPLFAEVYGYKNLRNLNYTDGLNYPGIDLADETAKVAIQVTATSGSEKVKDTLRKFIDYKLYEKYNRLIIYILTEKQGSYSGSGYEEIIQGRFIFDKDKDIKDYRDILEQVAAFQIDKASRVENILEANFGEGFVHLFQATPEPQTETLYLNLLELFFPDTLYVADLDIDRDEIIKNSGGALRRYSPTRKIAQAALKQLGLRFGVDWVCHENKVVTFHDLEDKHLSLTEIIDEGTITPLNSEEFYSIDENHERVFKSLLGRCLQQKLYHKQVSWQEQEKVFIFSEVDGNEIRYEEWQGKKKNERIVYERVMKNNKPDEILYCKHLAFQTQYKRFENRWYLLIKPDWFFSYDGYRQSYYGAEKIDWLKRRENNSHIFSQLRLIVYFLKQEKPSDFFVTRFPYPFLSFGELLSFGSAPVLS